MKRIVRLIMLSFPLFSLVVTAAIAEKQSSDLPIDPNLVLLGSNPIIESPKPVYFTDQFQLRSNDNDIAADISYPAALSSPGIQVGNTTFDEQHMGRMGRQVDWRSSQTAHFSWTKQLTKIPGSTVIPAYRAYIAGSYWTALGLGTDDSVFCTAIFNSWLIAGGCFHNAGSGAASHIAVWDGNSWSPLGSGVDDNVYSLAVYDNKLIAGGIFHNAGLVPANHVAQWNGSSWSALGTGVDDRVNALFGNASTLFAGGNFHNAGVIPADHIAYWNGSTWSAMGAGVNGNVEALNVHAVLPSPALIVGGGFNLAGGNPALNIAAWDGVNWSALGSGLNARVYAITEYNGRITAGGSFTGSGIFTANRIAAWTGTMWANFGSGMNSEVRALEVFNSNLVAGGRFDQAGGNLAEHIASWDGSSWSDVGSGTNNSVFALQSYNGSLIAGGKFTMAGNIPADHIAAWVDGPGWCDQTISPPTYYNERTTLDVRTDGEAIIADHRSIASSPFRQTDVWQQRALCPDPTNFSRESIDEIMWPSIEYQINGSDTVLHLFAQFYNASGWPQVLVYFRRVGGESGAWDYLPMVFDTINQVSQTVTASRVSRKVALTWLANLPATPGGGESVYNGSQVNNDLYYTISTDMGVNWGPKSNVIKSDATRIGWRGHTDLSALIDSHDNLHIIWDARAYLPTPAPNGSFPRFYGSRLFHWDENTNYTSCIKDADWALPATDYCYGDPWNSMSIVKMQLSECDGKLYALFVQFNDVYNGITIDCHNSAFTDGQHSGTANGELYVSISDDYGISWDVARNLTNSYTPRCDTSPSIVTCSADMWPSMSRFGMDASGGNWSGIPIVNPAGTYSGNMYLDIFYVNDKYPGSVFQDAGVWTVNPLRWFRLPCISPAAKYEMKCGNANGDLVVNVQDVTFIINFLYKGGRAPVPTLIADVNSNGITNVQDITYLINFLYKSGPAPGCI